MSEPKVNITITTSKKRRITTVVLTVALIGYFVFSPQSLWAGSTGGSGIFACFLPVFLLIVLSSILLKLSVTSKALKYTMKLCLLILCILAVFYASELLAGNFLWTLMASNPLAFLLGFLILLSLAAFFYALTGSVPGGVCGMTIVTVIFCFTNYFVMAFRGNPFLPTDILGLGTAVDVVSNYYFFWTTELTDACLLFAGVFVLSPYLKLPKLKKWQRAVARIAALVFPLVFVAITVPRDFVRGHDLEAYTWDQTIGAELNGSIWNFYANISESFASPPDGYSLEAVDQIASRYTSDSVTDATVKPDVILILGESWADVTPEGSVELNEPATPFMQSLAGHANSDYRNLVTSAFGGGTSRSEFHVLTGATQEYGTSQAPFQFDVTEHIPNIVDSFKALGYDTTALHTGRASSWGRDVAFPLMGFDRYLDKDALEVSEDDYMRGWIRDTVLYDTTLELLDANDSPQFTYLITIATHGEYRTEDYEASITVEEPEGDFSLTEQYLSVLNTSDQDLAAFIAALEEREDPTIVLFFGDHLPNIDDSYNEEVLAPSDPQWWDYKTIYGVWANYALPHTVYDDADYLSINYLGPYLLEKAGLPLTGYQKFLRQGAEEYSVTGLSGFQSPQGDFIDIEEARKTEFYFEQSVMQYNFIYDRENIPQTFFYLSE